ncbi:MAG: hypothetical protein C4320_03785 [Armatimonadota bacterium]
MRASSAIKDEIGIFSLPPGTTGPDFRARLAKVFAGEWRQVEDGTWFFNRAPLAAREEAQRESRRRKEESRKLLALAVRNLSETPELNGAAAEQLAKELRCIKAMMPSQDDYYTFNEAAYRRLSALENKGPAKRALFRVITALPPNLLAETPEEGRTVYSTVPTAMQKPMPVNVDAILDSYMREQNTWVDALGVRDDSSGVMYSSLESRRNRVTRPPSVVTITVENDYGTRQIELKAYDEKGEITLDGRTSVGELSRETEEESPREAIKDTFRVNSSPESQQLARLLKPEPQGLKKVDSSPFLDVVTKDPLSYAPSDFLLSYARAKGKGLMVRTSDNLFYLSFTVPEKINANGVDEIDTQVLKSFMELENNNDWIYVTPRGDRGKRSRFFPREDLARALAIVTKPGRLTVDQQAALTLSIPPQAKESYLTRLLNRASGQGYLNIGDDMMRLYALLSREQRQLAESPHGLNISSLSVGQRELINKMVYQGSAWFLSYQPDYSSPEGEEETAEDQQKRYQDLNEDQNLFWNGYLREPTFSLPNGIPETTILRISRSVGDKLKTGPVSRPWGVQEGQTVEISELAQYMIEKENPRRFPWSQSDWNRKNIEQMRLVNQERVTMTIHFTKKIVGTSSMSSEENISEEIYSLNTLPKSFLDKYREAYTDLVKQFKDQPVHDYGYYDEDRWGRRRSSPPPQ